MKIKKLVNLVKDKLNSFFVFLATFVFLVATAVVRAADETGEHGGTTGGGTTGGEAPSTNVPIQVGFTPPNLVRTLSFFIKFFFVIAGLAGLLYLILGAIAWVTSGGDKENVNKAREKIQAAVIGLVLLVAVLALVVTLEQLVFKQKVCFGISCELKIPSLID